MRNKPMRTTVELHLRLAEDVAKRLSETAQACDITESQLVEQALGLLFEQNDAPLLTDYWLSVATMRKDWDAMPDDWIADEVNDVVSPG